jgi:hypothetical protein
MAWALGKRIGTVRRFTMVGNGAQSSEIVSESQKTISFQSRSMMRRRLVVHRFNLALRYHPFLPQGLAMLRRENVPTPARWKWVTTVLTLLSFR